MFLDTYRVTHPEDRIVEWDLWDGTLPEFGPAAAEAKMSIFAGQQPTGAAAEAWRAAGDTFDRFAAADKYLFSIPMWNATVPYILKQFIDVVSQPGMMFSFDPQHGYTGLLTGRKATVIYTSAVYGEDRGPAFGADLQAPYFDDWLRWADIKDITSVHFRPNLATADPGAGRNLATNDAVAIAKGF
jgi:FMN-dependent NADH-azoreductase